MDMNTDDLLSGDTTITIDSNTATALVSALEKLAIQGSSSPPKQPQTSKDELIKYLWQNGEPVVHKVLWNITYYKDPAGDLITTLATELNEKNFSISEVLTAILNNTEGTIPYIVYCLYSRRILNEPWTLDTMAQSRSLIHPGENETILSILDTDNRRMSIREALECPYAVDLRHDVNRGQTTLRVNIRLYGHLAYYSVNPKGNFPTIKDMGSIMATYASLFMNPEKEISEILMPTRDPPMFQDPYEEALKQAEADKKQQPQWAPTTRRGLLTNLSDGAPERNGPSSRVRPLTDPRAESQWVPPAKRSSRR